MNKCRILKGKKPRILLLLALLTSITSTHSWSSTLATTAQISLEKLALIVAESEEVRAARESARRLLLSDETAKTKDGAAGLDRALDQWIMGQIVATINNDPARPEFFWAVDNIPREWHGHIFPGAAVAIENPDNVNRTAPIHGDWSYSLEGQFGTPKTAQISINVTRAESGQLRMGEAISTMTDREIEADENGRFSITLDKSPANGRKNHMQLKDGSFMLAVRDSHSDWIQQPTRLSLRVISGPQPEVRKSEEELIAESAAGLYDFVQYWLNHKNKLWGKPNHNQMSGPMLREEEGGWGVLAGGRFHIKDDEALVITTSDGEAAYTGFQISDPWTISPTPAYMTTSRNLSQLTANPDGNYTYVISLLDPGVANWINTAGLHEGWFMLRWQNLPADTEVSSLVKEVRLVKLDKLNSALPGNIPEVSIASRREEILQRIKLHNARSSE